MPNWEQSSENGTARSCLTPGMCVSVGVPKSHIKLIYLKSLSEIATIPLKEIAANVPVQND